MHLLEVVSPDAILISLCFILGQVIQSVAAITYWEKTRRQSERKKK